MAGIRATLGLALDRSVPESFAKLRAMSRQTSEAIARDAMVRRGGGTSANPELIAARAAHAEQSRLNRDIFRQQMAAQRQVDAENKRLARQRTREELSAIRERQREERAAIRERERDERRSAAAAMSLNRQRSAAMWRDYTAREREIDRLATRSSHRATRFMFPRPEGALGFARRTGNEILRGMGVDISFGGGIARSNELQEASELLSQNAWQPGQAGAAGRRVSEAKLTEEARSTAERWGIKGGALGISEGRAKFVSVTGDLETARGLTEDLAKLSAATGVGFADAMEAASAISVKLGDVPDKAQKIYGLMRGFAWQGKLAAVEISHLAASMPRLISGVARFEGDIGTNMQKLGVLAQMARGGPAGTAKEAATGVARLSDLLVTPTRVKAMKKVGLKHEDIFNSEGLIRDPFEIIKKALTITGGDPLKMRVAFASVMGSRPVERFADIYRGAGGGQKGLAAIDEETKRIMSGGDVGMSDKMVQKLAEEYGQTRAVKARKFQESFDRITAGAADRLAPALEKLEEPTLRVASALANFVAWVPDNLGKTIALMAGYSISRALSESLFRALMEKAINSSFGRNAAGTWNVGSNANGWVTRRNAGGNLTSVGGTMGAIGTGVGIGAGVAAGLYFSGTQQYSSGVAKTDEISKTLVNAHGAELGQAIVEAETKRDQYRKDQGVFGGALNSLMNLFGAGDSAEMKGLSELLLKKKLEFAQWQNAGGKLSPEAQQDLEAQKLVSGWRKEKELDPAALGRGVAEAMKGQIMQVRVTNAGDIGMNKGGGGPEVDDSGRAVNGKKR